ncbi:MAG: hypothetical protein OXD48_09030 [Litoreibacter sp.]|nr:hypothetical protein [Litoreibacter sp.]
MTMLPLQEMNTLCSSATRPVATPIKQLETRTFAKSVFSGTKKGYQKINTFLSRTWIKDGESLGTLKIFVTLERHGDGTNRFKGIFERLFSRSSQLVSSRYKSIENTKIDLSLICSRISIGMYVYRLAPHSPLKTWAQSRIRAACSPVGLLEKRDSPMSRAGR